MLKRAHHRSRSLFLIIVNKNKDWFLFIWMIFSHFQCFLLVQIYLNLRLSENCFRFQCQQDLSKQSQIKFFFALGWSVEARIQERAKYKVNASYSTDVKWTAYLCWIAVLRKNSSAKTECEQGLWKKVYSEKRDPLP